MEDCLRTAEGPVARGKVGDRPILRAFFLIAVVWLILFSLPTGTCYATSGQSKADGSADLSVAIDIGHSKLDSGALSARGVPEYEFNQEVVRLLYTEMLHKGYTKSFTISHNNEDVALVTRADIANRREADLLLSIHHDSVQPRYLRQWTFNGKRYFYSDKYKGFSIFYSNKNGMPQKSLLFAGILGTEMLKEGFSPSLHHAEKIEGENRKLVDKNRGIYEYDDLIILKNAKMAAVLLECGIIVNRNEEEQLCDPTNRRKIVLAILRSLDSYCKFIQKAASSLQKTP